MKRILFIETGSGFGGSARALFRLLANLDKNKFEPIVAYLHKGSAIADIEKIGIELHEILFKKIDSSIIDILRSALWLKKY